MSKGAPWLTEGHITPRKSWPREATPTGLQPNWAGEFASFDDWVSFATQRLTGTRDPLMGSEVPAICIDAIGRRCTMGGHFMRARDEGAFPVRFFWDMAHVRPACINHPDQPSRVNLDGEDLCQDCADAWARAEGEAAMARGDDHA